MDIKAISSSEISKPSVSENKSFDPDKRIDVNQKQDTKDNLGYDVDKRVETAEDKKYYDDNGNVYRVGDKLVADNNYKINGYEYKTDGEGRIVSAKGKLHLKEHSGRQNIIDKKEVVGEGYQKTTDDRGHLIGDQFGGSNGKENLLPQDAKLNQGEVKNLEKSLAKQVDAGNEVYLKVEPHYEQYSKRPDSYTYTYTINGDTNVKFYRNGEN